MRLPTLELPRWRFVAFAIVVAATTACRGTTARDSAAGLVTDEQSVYAALFTEAARRTGGKTVWVEATTSSYVAPSAGASFMFQRRLDSLPPGLSTRLALVSAAAKDARRLALPVWVRIADSTTSQRIQETGLGAAVVYSVSPIAFSEDSRNALVYRESLCGAVCGYGEVLWFARELDGTWHQRAHVILWQG
jgi:hypothetical protein